MTAPIIIELDAKTTVEMVGTGPWKLFSNSDHSHEIKDSTGAIANPTVTAPFGGTGRKANRNTVWAKKSKTQAVVDAANAKLAEAQ